MISLYKLVLHKPLTSDHYIVGPLGTVRSLGCLFWEGVVIDYHYID
jgi:hypothetical protein